MGEYTPGPAIRPLNLKSAFFLVKFLEDVGYQGMRHFDARAYRTPDHDDVGAFASGCMRTYLIRKEKARQLNEDVEIQNLLAEITADDGTKDAYKGDYTRAKAERLKVYESDRVGLGQKGQPYERLDQLVVELLLGAR